MRERNNSGVHLDERLHLRRQRLPHSPGGQGQNHDHLSHGSSGRRQGLYRKTTRPSCFAVKRVREARSRRVALWTVAFAQASLCNHTRRKPRAPIHSDRGTSADYARPAPCSTQNILPSRAVLPATESGNNKSRPIARSHPHTTAPVPYFARTHLQPPIPDQASRHQSSLAAPAHDRVSLGPSPDNA